MRLVFSGILADTGIMGAAIGIAGLVITCYLKSRERVWPVIGSRAGA